MSAAITTTPTARRPGPAAWFRMIQAEAKMTIDDIAGLIVPLGLPLLILVMQAMAIDDLGVEIAPGVTAMDYYLLPVVVTMVVATIAVINMPSFLSSYRKSKVLRRLSVTPASPVMVLVAQFVVSFIQMLLGITVAFAIAMIFFDANFPQDPWMAIAVLLATCAALYGVGMIVASVAPTPNSSVAIGLVAFFALAALGGMFGQVENLPSVLQDIAEWLPFASAVDAFQSAWVGESVDVQNWLVFGITAVLGIGVASALFRWE